MFSTSNIQVTAPRFWMYLSLKYFMSLSESCSVLVCHTYMYIFWLWHDPSAIIASTGFFEHHFSRLRFRKCHHYAASEFHSFDMEIKPQLFTCLWLPNIHIRPSYWFIEFCINIDFLNESTTIDSLLQSRFLESLFVRCRKNYRQDAERKGGRSEKLGLGSLMSTAISYPTPFPGAHSTDLPSRFRLGQWWTQLGAQSRIAELTSDGCPTFSSLANTDH